MTGSTDTSNKNKTVLRWLLLCIAAAMLIIGIVNKDYADVLTKAVMICMECIGIG